MKRATSLLWFIGNVGTIVAGLLLQLFDAMHVLQPAALRALGDVVQKPKQVSGVTQRTKEAAEQAVCALARNVTMPRCHRIAQLCQQRWCLGTQLRQFVQAHKLVVGFRY